jgi:hypothetical protein
VVTELGDGVVVSGGTHPTIWKGVSSNFEDTLTLGSYLKQVYDDVGKMETDTVQMDEKVDQLLRDIGGLNREVLQIVTLRSGFQDQRTQVTEIDYKLLSLGSLLQTFTLALQCASPSGSGGELIDGKPISDVVKTLNLQVEVIQYRMQSQAVHLGGVCF